MKIKNYLSSRNRKVRILWKKVSSIEDVLDFVVINKETIDTMYKVENDADEVLSLLGSSRMTVAEFCSNIVLKLYDIDFYDYRNFKDRENSYFYKMIKLNSLFKGIILNFSKYKELRLKELKVVAKLDIYDRKTIIEKITYKNPLLALVALFINIADYMKMQLVNNYCSLDDYYDYILSDDVVNSFLKILGALANAYTETELFQLVNEVENQTYENLLVDKTNELIDNSNEKKEYDSWSIENYNRMVLKKLITNLEIKKRDYLEYKF